MAIRILDWRGWKHVSAVSENEKKEIQTYLSPGSKENRETLGKEILALRNNNGFKLTNIDTESNTLTFNLNAKEYTIKINYLTRNKTKFVLDQQDLVQKFPNDTNIVDALSTIIIKTNKTKDEQQKDITEYSYQYREIYPKIETGKSYEQVTLPTKQDGFKFGLDQNEFNKFVFDHVDDSTLYGHDSVNTVFNALATTKTGKLHATGAGNLYGSISLSSNKTVGYAQAIREEILNRTIHDMKLEPDKKIKQVLEIEKMRLEDEIYNEKNSRLRFFKQSSIKTKQEKLSAIKTALLVPNLETINALLENSAIKKGFLSNRTYGHLVDLQQTLDKQLKAEKPKPESNLKVK